VTWAEVGAILIALGALATAWTNGRRAHSQNAVDDASAAQSLSTAAAALVRPLQEAYEHLAEKHEAQAAQLAALEVRNRKQEERIDHLETEVRNWRDFALALLRQLRGLGHEPVATPPDWVKGGP
jgi:hypothetical protein